MQGFFVKAVNTGTITVKDNSCVSKISYLKQDVKINSLKFRLNNSERSCDEVLMRVNPNSTSGFDDNMDALKLEGRTGSSALYIPEGNIIKYAVYTIPTVNSSLSIPISIRCSQNGTYTISVSGSFNFEYRYPVMLRDKELNTFIDLRADSVYSFYHTTGMNNDRFGLQFDSPSGIAETEDLGTRVNVLHDRVEVSGNSNEVFTFYEYHLV